MATSNLLNLKNLDEDLRPKYSIKGEDPYSYLAFIQSLDKVNGYIRNLEKLVNLVNFNESHRRIVDVGCGAGTTMNIVLENLSRNSFPLDSLEVFMLDVSENALSEARGTLSKFKGLNVDYIVGDSRDLAKSIRSKVDIVFYCNSIHYVDDKRTLIKSIVNHLNPGGLFAFNSSFIRDSYERTESQKKFYVNMLLSANRFLRKLDLKPGKSNVSSRYRLWGEEYVSLVKDVSPCISYDEDVWKMSAKEFASFCYFRDFVEGSLPNIDVKVGARALAYGVFDAFEKLSLDGLDRNWINVVCRKQS